MSRTLIAIGGGELKSKSTVAIDRYIASLVKKRAAPARGTALFLGTASHDSLPYFNSFRKIYTSLFDIKAEVALLTKKDVPIEHNLQKIAAADLIYVGGGDTLYMLDVWREKGIIEPLFEAYRNGTVLAGLSAGAICWFEKMYTDSARIEGGKFAVRDGLGLIKGIMTPHYDERKEFDEVSAGYPGKRYAVENDAAAVFEDEEFAFALGRGVCVDGVTVPSRASED